MDRLRSEDLKEEKVVTAPTIIVAGRHGGSTSRVGAIPSVREEVHSLRFCCLCRGSELDFLEPWLMQPRAAVTIPLYNRVILVRPFDRTVFSSRPSRRDRPALAFWLGLHQKVLQRATGAVAEPGAVWMSTSSNRSYSSPQEARLRLLIFSS
jgi:hypothetical protein